MSIMITQESNVKRSSQFCENHISNFKLNLDFNMKCCGHEARVEFNNYLHKVMHLKILKLFFENEEITKYVMLLLHCKLYLFSLRNNSH
jgi:hypothetical protein